MLLRERARSHNESCTSCTMSEGPFQSHRSRRSSSGRLIKLKEPTDAVEVLAVNYPSKRAAIERSRRSVKRSWHSARVSAIRDLEARNAKLVSEVAELQSRSSYDSTTLSKLSTAELEDFVCASNVARRELQGRGWIARWDACDMEQAVWVDVVELLPASKSYPASVLGIKLPSCNGRVALAKIRQLQCHHLGISHRKGDNWPRLSKATKLDFKRQLLLHCVNKKLPKSIKRGSRVYMEEKSNGRKLVARVLSVESASHKKAPYRKYGNQWQSYMRDSNTALPALVFRPL